MCSSPLLLALKLMQQEVTLPPLVRHSPQTLPKLLLLRLQPLLLLAVVAIVAPATRLALPAPKMVSGTVSVASNSSVALPVPGRRPWPWLLVLLALLA